jgi:glycosyltransferase involved in cell wall biosynthesis
LEDEPRVLEGVVMAPRVSVVINCLNGEKFVAEALDSVLAQTFGDYEVVFFDNASTDGTADIARSYGDRIRYFRGSETVPLGKARNAALAEAKGELIAFLDADDIWLPRKLERQVPLFDDPKAGVAFTDAVYFNEAGKEKLLYGSRVPPSGDVSRALLTSYALCLSTTIVRRSAVESLAGWFDDRFEMAEEVDVFRRLAFHWRFAYLPEALTRYRVHASSTTWRKMWLVPYESELMLEKFSREVSGFDRTYAPEIRTLRGLIEYEYARCDMLKGDRVSARQRLAAAKHRNWRSVVLFALTFVPSAMYYRLLGMHGVVPARESR